MGVVEPDLGEREVKRSRADETRTTNMRLTVAVALALAAATMAIYWQSLGHSFSNVDDVEYVTGNRMVLQGLSAKTIVWALTAFHSANWHPITWISHMADVQVFGLWAGGHHLTSILLHIANTLLLLLLLLRLTGSLGKSAFVAGLFALHPQHVESVAWIAERKDVLSTFFLLLALLGYLWYVQRPSIGRYLLVALAFALGLMAKPMLVTVPILLLLLDYWPLSRLTDGRRFRRLVLEKIPLAVLSAASCALTLRAQSAFGAVTALTTISTADRLMNALMSAAIYISKTFWPTRLANFYPYPIHGWPVAEVVAAGVLLIGLTVVALRSARARPYLLFGWLWYIVTLLPVIGIVQVGEQARADRYTYIPLIGIFLIVAYVLPEMLARLRLSTLQTPLAIAVLAALGAASYVQVGYWKDGISTARRAVAVTDINWYSQGSLGNALESRAEGLYAQSKNTRSQRLAREAERHLRLCVRLAPQSADAHDLLARSLGLQDSVDEAIPHLREAVHLAPNNPQFHSHLGMALQTHGKLDGAISEFEEAVRLDPSYVEGQGNLALAYYASGDYASAWEHVHACERAGGRAPADFRRKLSEKMPDPGQ